MARNPYYSGRIGTGTQSAIGQTFRPFADSLHEFAAGDDSSNLFKSIFYKRENDPDAQLADYRRAQTDAERQKIDAANRGVEAGQTFNSTLGELTDRVGGPQQVGANASKMLPVVLGHLQTGVANGMDPKEAAAAAKIWAASTGDAGVIAAVQSGIEGKYLGENESPTIARQDAIRDDNQAFEANKQEADLRLKKYGFDIESADRRYNTNVDASTARRGQDVSAGTARRGQDIGSTDQRRGQDMTDARARDTAYGATTTVTTKDPGSKGRSPALWGLFGDKGEPSRAPSTTKVTTRAPATPKRMVYDPRTGGLVAK
jgi:hypothetical protein